MPCTAGRRAALAAAAAAAATGGGGCSFSAAAAAPPVARVHGAERFGSIGTLEPLPAPPGPCSESRSLQGATLISPTRASVQETCPYVPNRASS